MPVDAGIILVNEPVASLGIALTQAVDEQPIFRQHSLGSH
jgi:hypothetical protein